MKKSDAALIESHPVEFQKARTAAAFALRADRRFLGAPKMRTQLEEICALNALGSDTASIGKSALEAMSIDNRNLYVEGIEIGTKAARAVVDI